MAAGDVVGVFVGGLIADVIGRKKTLGIGTVLTAVGVGVQVGSHDWKAFLVSLFESAFLLDSVTD